MVGRVLVTTADERTWPKEKKTAVLFIGEWCRRYSRKNVWQLLDYRVAPYHWDDRVKLLEDYKYLLGLYEKLLSELSEKLNEIHAVNYSIRYWRILIGPWLGYFIQMLFDRWSMLKQTIEQEEITECFVLGRDTALVIPNDMAHFDQMYIDDDWNEAIYGQLMNLCWKDRVRIKRITCPNAEFTHANVSYKGFTGAIKSHIEKFWIPLFNRIRPKENGFFFIASYLPLMADFRLQIELGQFPKFWRTQHAPITDVEIRERMWNFDRTDSETHSFENVARELIPLHIPTSYLEGYKKLVRFAHSQSWPKKPSCIFTSAAYSADDLFKAWSAEMTEQGVQLYIGQHGGHFGMTPFSFHEEHQIDISDKWISWGWRDTKRENITPIGNIKEISRRPVKYDPEGSALVIETTVPRYSYHLYSAPIAGQWIEYFREQCQFIDALSPELQQEIVMRIYPGDTLGWDQKKRWVELYPKIKLEVGEKSVRALARYSRLIVSTYNGTACIEPLVWNIPTIMFWNPGHWELNDESSEYFELLKSVGIFHESPVSAAQHMTSIWDNVDDWWASEEVQSARMRFCDQYSRNSDNSFAQLKKMLQNEAIKPKNRLVL